MPPRGQRPPRVAEAVRRVVTAFLREEARDPRIGLVTITGVRMTADLQRATVRFVAHGDTDQQSQSLEGLRAAAPAIRRKIGAELRLRTVPELGFEFDKGLEHAQRIERLLASLKRGEEPAT